MMYDDLNGYGYKALTRLAATAHNERGTKSFCYEKDTRTAKKHDLISYLMNEFTQQQIELAIAKTFDGQTPGLPFPAAEDSARSTEDTAPQPASLLKQTPANATAIAQQFAALLASMQQAPALDESAVRALVNRCIADAALPRALHIVVNENILADLPAEHRHPMFEKILRLSAAGVNVMMKGPAGCGKTFLGEQLARALKSRQFAAISGSAGASEAQLIGRLLPTGENGKFEYAQSQFVEIYETGGTFLFDEIDAFDPNMLIVANSATANGGFHVEIRQASPYVKRHAETHLLAAANTYGTGADAMYVGRFQLDAATLDRWYVVELDYDPVFESALFGGDCKKPRAWTPAAAPTAQELRALGDWVLNVRQKAADAKLRRVVSSRMIQKAVTARTAGIPADEVKSDLLNGWTADERARVGMGA